MPIRPAVRTPAEPRLPASLDPGADLDLEDEIGYRGLDLADLDLADRRAGSVEFEQCRFSAADLSRTTLTAATLRDCLVDRSNLANLRAERSTMVRVRLSVSRLTGLQWIDGAVRDVTVAQCRADLASFRFSALQHVVFEDCNLTRADFQNADVSGVVFRRCDLTAAQFSHATMVGTRFADCELAGIGGVASFAGAVVASRDLAGLAHALAAALRERAARLRQAAGGRLRVAGRPGHGAAAGRTGTGAGPDPRHVGAAAEGPGGPDRAAPAAAGSAGQGILPRPRSDGGPDPRA